MVILNEENVQDTLIVEEVINDEGLTFEDDADHQILDDLACSNNGSKGDMFEDNGEDELEMDNWSSSYKKAKRKVYL